MFSGFAEPVFSPTQIPDSARQDATHFDCGYKKAQRHLAKMIKPGLIGDNGKAKTSPNNRYVQISF